MASSGKMEAGMEIRAPANVYHDVISSKLYKVPSMCPELVQKVDLIKGNWGCKGTVISWTFLFDGASQECKEVIEDVDDSNMSTTFNVIEGDILKFYKSLKLIVQAIPRGQETSYVNLTVIYEKLNKDDGPEPNLILELLLTETKAVAAYLMQPHA